MKYLLFIILALTSFNANAAKKNGCESLYKSAIRRATLEQQRELARKYFIEGQFNNVIGSAVGAPITDEEIPIAVATAIFEFIPVRDSLTVSMDFSNIYNYVKGEFGGEQAYSAIVDNDGNLTTYLGTEKFNKVSIDKDLNDATKGQVKRRIFEAINEKYPRLKLGDFLNNSKIILIKRTKQYLLRYQSGSRVIMISAVLENIGRAKTPTAIITGLYDSNSRTRRSSAETGI